MASNKDKQTSAETKNRPGKGNNVVYIGTIIILVITILAFVVAPAIGSGAASSSNEYELGSWNGTPVVVAQGGEFLNQVQYVKSQYESQGLKADEAYYGFQIWRSAFNNVISSIAIQDYANKAGIDAGESAIDEQIKQDSAFQEKGVFSYRKYREAPNAQKLEARKKISESIKQQTYLNDISSIYPSAKEISFIAATADSMRSIEYVAFPFKDYPISELEKYADKNSDKFEKAKLSKITITSSEKEANQILDKIKSGETTFEDAAKNLSQDSYATKGGDIGYKYAYEIRNDLADADSVKDIYALQDGEISKVYATATSSWVFFKVNEKAVKANSSDSDFQDVVYNYINRYEKGLLEDYILVSARDFANTAKQSAVTSEDFATLATGFGKNAVATDSFPLNYGEALYFAAYNYNLIKTLNTNDHPALVGAQTNERFLTTVFGLEAGKISEPLIMNDNAIVIRVNEVVTQEESSQEVINSFYPYLASQNARVALSNQIMKSPLLKDNFIATYTNLMVQK